MTKREWKRRRWAQRREKRKANRLRARGFTRYAPGCGWVKRIYVASPSIVDAMRLAYEGHLLNIDDWREVCDITNIVVPPE